MFHPAMAEPAAAAPRPSVAVIIGHPGIGDMVWHQPALASIARHHGAPVALFARPTTQSPVLFAASPEVAEVVEFERGQGRDYFPTLADLVGKLRRGRYSRVYVLNRRPNLALAAGLAGIPERYGFGAPLQAWLLNRGRWIYEDGKLSAGGPVIHCRQFMAVNGLPAPAPAPMLAATPLARSQARGRFAAMPRPWIAVGATCNAEDRRWPAPSFARLAAQLECETRGTVFLHGGPHHAWQIDQVLEHMPVRPPRVVDLSRAALRFDEVVGLLAESDLFVGNDSGPLNVAAALGLPAYGLFGGAAPHESISPLVRALLPATGEPDLETGMMRLTVEQVLEAVGPGLGAGGAPPAARARVASVS